MTNFSGISRQGLWSWLTPERAVLVMPVLAGLVLSMALLSVGITPLTMRVREQNKVVEELTTKADFVPVLRQQLAVLKRSQVEREQQLDRLLDLVAGTSELQTFLAELNDLGRVHNVAINTINLGLWNGLTTPDQATPPLPVVILLSVVWRNVPGDTVTGPFEVLAFFNRWNAWMFVVISEMNVRKQIQLIEDGVERVEVAMDITLSAYGRQPKSQDPSQGDET